MKKEFFILALNAMLIASFSTGLVPAEEKKKEKVQIVVVEKKDNNKTGYSGESKKPRHGDRQSQ